MEYVVVDGGGDCAGSSVGVPAVAVRGERLLQPLFHRDHDLLDAVGHDLAQLLVGVLDLAVGGGVEVAAEDKKVRGGLFDVIPDQLFYLLLSGGDEN